MITSAVRNWLDEAIRRDALPDGFVHRVLISCEFDVSENQRPQGAMRQLRLDCTAVVEAESGEWSGSSRKAERWTRNGSAPWEVVDV